MKILATQKYVFAADSRILVRRNGDTLKEEWTTKTLGHIHKIMYAEEEESLFVSTTEEFLKYDMITLQKQWTRTSPTMGEFTLISSDAMACFDYGIVRILSISSGNCLAVASGVFYESNLASMGNNEWILSSQDIPIRHWEYNQRSVSEGNGSIILLKEVRTGHRKNSFVYHPSLHKVTAFAWNGTMEIYDCRSWTLLWTSDRPSLFSCVYYTGVPALVPGTFIKVIRELGNDKSFVLTNGNRIIKTEPGEAFSFLPSGNKMIVYDQGILRKVDIYRRDRMMSLLHGQSHFPSVVWRMLRQKI